MKYKVLKTFKDKYTKEIQTAGSVIEITEDRASEIVANLGEGFIEKVQAKNPKKSKTDE